MDWNDLKFFLEVARGGSLTRAADVLRVSQSTVGRRIAELEARLATRLFARHQNGLPPDGRRPRTARAR
ncbi:LysR family transcriptional regulator [Massilia sp. GER05]|uniref:LysR family transcriptional regulator n=1 Tax=Massilia sp. GER05 TaxID=3394605 RepID=UPI003F824E66